MWYAINMKYSQQVLDQQSASRAQREDRRWPQTTSAALEAPKNLQNSKKDQQDLIQSPRGHPGGAPHVQIFQRSSVKQSPFRVKAF